MSNIARLGVVLGLNTAEFQSGMAGAVKQIDSFKTKAAPLIAAGTAIATVFGVMAKSAIDEMDALYKMSQAAGVSMESLSGLNYAANLSGLSTEELGKNIGRLSKNLNEAASGTGDALEAFKRLKIDPTQFKESDEALLALADKFAGMKDGVNKTALAMQIFGRSGMSMIPFLNMGAEGIQNLLDEAKTFNQVVSTETGQAAEQFNDNLERMKRIGDGLIKAMAEKWLPTINTFTNNLLEAYKKTGSFLDSTIASAFSGAAPKSMNEATEAVVRHLKKVRELEEVYKTAPDWMKSDVKNTLDLAKARLEVAENQARSFVKAVELPPVVVTGDDEPLPKPKPDKFKNMFDQAKLLASEYERERQHSLDMLKIKEQMNGLTENEKRVQEAVNEVLNATSQKLKEIADKREAAAGRDAPAYVLAEYDKQAEAIQKLSEEYVNLARVQQQESIAAQRTFSYGWNTAFKQYAEDAENYATIGRDMFSSITGAMSNAIDQFVESGKFSFKDFTASVIKDLIKIQLQAQATALFSKGLKLVMGAIGAASGGIGGATTIGAGSLEGGEGALSFAVDMTRANGGTVSADSSYLVGERGPEIFMPSRSGTVIPNNNLGGMGGVTNITNNYIDAIDTKSFEDRIYGSSRAVWAANAYANKGLSNSRSRT